MVIGLSLLILCTLKHPEVGTKTLTRYVGENFQFQHRMILETHPILTHLYNSAIPKRFYYSVSHAGKYFGTIFYTGQVGVSSDKKGQHHVNHVIGFYYIF